MATAWINIWQCLVGRGGWNYHQISRTPQEFCGCTYGAEPFKEVSFGKFSWFGRLNSWNQWTHAHQTFDIVWYSFSLVLFLVNFQFLFHPQPIVQELSLLLRMSAPLPILAGDVMWRDVTWCDVHRMQRDSSCDTGRDGESQSAAAPGATGASSPDLFRICQC